MCWSTPIAIAFACPTSVTISSVSFLVSLYSISYNVRYLYIFYAISCSDSNIFLSSLYIKLSNFKIFLKKNFKFKVLIAQVISSNGFNYSISTISRFVSYNPLIHQNFNVWDSWTEAVSCSFTGDSTCINIINCLQYKM